MASWRRSLLAGLLLCCALLTLGAGQETEADTLFLLLEDGSRMVEVLLDSHSKMADCAVFGDGKVIRQVLRGVSEERRQVVSREQLTSLVKDCFGLHSHLPDSHLRRKRFVKAIYPGTKWCGAGNIADHYDDLGALAGTDACCRTHDHCNVTIGALSWKYGIFNIGLYTRSHCNCEQVFYDCLRADNSTTSGTMGYIYFNVLNPRCLTEGHPEVCAEKGWWFTCKRKEPDLNRTVIMFADNKFSF